MLKSELKRLKRSILEDLEVGKWPTDCIVKRKAIKIYIQELQTQFVTYKQEKRFDFIISYVFDIINRIFAIDSAFTESKSSSFNQVGYSDFVLNKDKFVLLKETKLLNLSKLPMCKVVMVDIAKIYGGTRSF
jgi:hypothetical protein